MSVPIPNENALLIATVESIGRVIPYVAHGGTALCLCYRTSDDAVLLVRQHRPVVGRATLEVPAGLVDAGETAEHAALRELREETGHNGQAAHFMGTILTSVGMSDEAVSLFWCDDWVESLESAELASEWVPRTEAVERILGAGGDAKSLVAMLLLDRALAH